MLHRKTLFPSGEAHQPFPYRDETRRRQRVDVTLIEYRARHEHEKLFTAGATVAEWLDRSPSTKAIRVQSPGHRIFARGNRARRCRWSVGFLGDIPFPSPFHSSATPYPLQSPSSALETLLLRTTQISSLTTPRSYGRRLWHWS
ncbi:hypothetical protein PR048_029542 [Dryococelus australis]|uniref:Uncharacterized protein n=1 Tax=Dryococelus australis TaxID=614101 RepID=A0ABQ9GDP3_9NEOP|nr:hypothetical protein PR048_029542 [Dryococelus australis]